MLITKHQQSEINMHQNELTFPRLFLSSEGAGWEGLLVQAYHEPMIAEEWTDPVVSDIVLILLTKGTVLVEQRRKNGSWKVQSLRQGDLLLKPGGSIINELRWRSLSEPTQTLRIYLSQDLFSRTIREVTGYSPVHLTLLGRSGFQDPLLSQIGFALLQELQQPSPIGKLYAQTAAHMLAVHLVRYYTSSIPRVKESLQGLTQSQINRVADFILAHLNEEISLDRLAQQVGFSPHYFAYLFRQKTGESPYQYVLHQRIERAQHLLKEGKIPLSQIALECGFANQSHLSRVFKQHLGLTPRAYRHSIHSSLGKASDE